MKNLLAILFLIFCAGNRLQAADSENSRPRISASLGFYGKNIDSEYADSRLAGVAIGGAYSHRWIREMEAKLRAGIELESGASRMRFTDELAAKQSLKLYHAELVFYPIPEISLAVGTLDQAIWESPQLLDSQTFPAFQQKLNLGFLELNAEQAVANDTSSVGNWGSWPNRPPTFFIERAKLHYENESLNLATYASHFLFENLSSESAFKSRYFGNSITGNFIGNSEFDAKFQGFEIGLQNQLRILPSFNLILNANYLKNLTRSDNSTLLSVGIAWSPQTSWKLIPKVFIFSADNDTTPALYNSKLLGHNNRNGWGTSVNFQLPKLGMEGSLLWANAELKNISAVQANQQWIQLNWKMNYDLL